MRWPLALLVLLLAGALLLPGVLPVAADGDGGDGRDGGKDDDEDPRDEDGRDEGDGKGDDDDGGDDGRGEGDDRDDKGKDDKDEGRERHGDRNGKGKGRGGHGHGEEDRDRDEEDRVAEAAPSPVARGAPSAAPHLQVSQDYDVSPGMLTFTFRVTNPGIKEAQDVRLDGELPQAGAWVLTDPRCMLKESRLECDLGDLRGGDAVEVTARSVLAGPVTAFTNVVQVYTPFARLQGAPSSP